MTPYVGQRVVVDSGVGAAGQCSFAPGYVSWIGPAALFIAVCMDDGRTDTVPAERVQPMSPLHETIIKQQQEAAQRQAAEQRRMWLRALQYTVNRLVAEDRALTQPDALPMAKQLLGLLGVDLDPADVDRVHLMVRR